MPPETNAEMQERADYYEKQFVIKCEQLKAALNEVDAWKARWARAVLIKNPSAEDRERATRVAVELLKQAGEIPEVKSDG